MVENNFLRVEKAIKNIINKQRAISKEQEYKQTYKVKHFIYIMECLQEKMKRNEYSYRRS